MVEHPVPDKAAAQTLGEALRGLGYSGTEISNLLGDDDLDTRADVVVAERRLPETRLATAVRLLFLQLPVSTHDAVRALGRRAVDALEATALADVDDEVSPRVRILPVQDLLIASDDYPPEDRTEPPDYVAAYTPTSKLCEALTPRRRSSRALDVGTGSGVQALLAARHARHVVATDVNPRALAYTELNAALNGLTNVEGRQGNLFEPVAGESFDLITCNAPYVVSPEHRWAYRDAGLEGDEASAQIVREAASYLSEGGFATLVVSWLAGDADAPDERVLAWTESVGCDSWILPVWGADPLDHAAIWNEDLDDEPDAFGEAVDEWTGYLERLGASWVTEGAVLLHRRTGQRHTARVDEVDEELVDDAGAQIERAFAARARLAALNGPDDLLDARLEVATTLRLEREVPGGEAHIELTEGTNSVLEVTQPMLDVVASLDGRTRLGDIAQSSALRREALRVSRELLELGALRFR